MGGPAAFPNPKFTRQCTLDHDSTPKLTACRKPRIPCTTRFNLYGSICLPGRSSSLVGNSSRSLGRAICESVSKKTDYLEPRIYLAYVDEHHSPLSLVVDLLRGSVDLPRAFRALAITACLVDHVEDKRSF